VSDSGKDAFAIFGLMVAASPSLLSAEALCAKGEGLPVMPSSNAANAACNAADAAMGVISAPRASRSRLIARACNCDTRDSLTPSSVPMSFMVTSL